MMLTFRAIGGRRGASVCCFVFSCLFLAFTGCRRAESPAAAAASAGSNAAGSSPIILNVTAEAPTSGSWRLGEAVVLTVRLENKGSSGLEIAGSAKGSIQFWSGLVGETRRVESRPAPCPSEVGAESRSGTLRLEPGSAVSRRFILTDLTRHEGEVAIQATLEAADGQRAFSPAVRIAVSGERLFTRDADGLISKADAMRVAETELGGAPGASEAVLIKDKTGSLKWWVNVRPGAATPTAEADAAAAEGGKLGALIDPYVGRVWARARPFDPAHPNQP